jgi:hypothetical protein
VFFPLFAGKLLFFEPIHYFVKPDHKALVFAQLMNNLSSRLKYQPNAIHRLPDTLGELLQTPRPEKTANKQTGNDNNSSRDY